jgi:hypothetical protein
MIHGVVALFGIDRVNGGGDVKSIGSTKTKLLGHDTVDGGASGGSKLLGWNHITPANIGHHSSGVYQLKPPIEVGLKQACGT